MEGSKLSEEEKKKVEKIPVERQLQIIQEIVDQVFTKKEPATDKEQKHGTFTSQGSYWTIALD